MKALTRERAAEIIDRFAAASILVVGDVMIDQFVFGNVNRISPEAPVPVVEFGHEEYRVGGAANVAHNVRTLGGCPDLVSLIGRDKAGDQLRAELLKASIDPADVLGDRDRVTTRKLRIVTTRNQQVARVDYEVDAAPTASIQRDLMTRIAQAAESADAIVVSDYLKGVITGDVMTQVLSSGRTRGIPVLVDPKIPHLSHYAGCSLITPNHHEAEHATHMRIRSNDDARAAARAMQLDLSCDSVLMTRSEHGMWLLDGAASKGRAGDPAIRWEGSLPAAAREVADVTGAGDTVIATTALGLAAGATLVEAAQLANHAAGLVVGRFGPSTVTGAELRAAV